VLGLLLATAVAAAAGEAPVSPAPGCPFSADSRANTVSVAKDHAITLDDGRLVRLAAIELPNSADGTIEAAGTALSALVNGRELTLRHLGRQTDRYSRVSAHVFVRDGDAERWIQAELVAQGLARVSARVGDRTCAAQLLALETKARANRLGLWAEPYYAMRQAAEPLTLAADRGRFTIVEGRVLSVRESGGTVYVNFGRRWSEDFTVTIAKRNERMFANAGMDPKALSGRRIRVRGWIEERGGPWIDATRPEQIELADRN
jgi:endonuclease YncB( thermonuclease family)